MEGTFLSPNCLTYYVPEVNMYYIEVKFLEGNDRLYSYRCIFPVEVGDMVVVQARNTYGLATVREISDTAPPIVCKDVVCVVDLKKYEQAAGHANTVEKLSAEVEDKLNEFKKKQQIDEFMKADFNNRDLYNRLEFARLTLASAVTCND